MLAASFPAMDYFSRAWALGDLSDDEAEGVEARYRDYIGSLDPEGAVRRFAETVGLNDAYVDRLDKTDGALTLRLLTGDLQRGYGFTSIRYEGGDVVEGREALERAVAVRPTEIWYDEFSSAPSPVRMVHRFLLVAPGAMEDRGEVHIAFDGFSFSQVPAAEWLLPPL